MASTSKLIDEIKGYLFKYYASTKPTPIFTLELVTVIGNWIILKQTMGKDFSPQLTNFWNIYHWHKCLVVTTDESKCSHCRQSVPKEVIITLDLLKD